VVKLFQVLSIKSEGEANFKIQRMTFCGEAKPLPTDCDLHRDFVFSASIRLTRLTLYHDSHRLVLTSNFSTSAVMPKVFGSL
jgi:hypothetical protein